MGSERSQQLRVLIISLNYLPEQTGFGPHVAALAESLASNGHTVTVLTGFPFSPQWSRWPAYRGSVFDRQNLNGVEVVRSSHFIPRRPGRALQRLLMEATFVAMATLSLAQVKQSPNVVFYCGAQPSLAMLARLIAWWKRIPYIVSIQDLAAQAAFDVGIVRWSVLATMLDRFEYAAYRHASSALVLCEAFRTELLSRAYPADRIFLIRSPIDVDHIRPVAPSGTFRATHGLAPGDFVVLCAGSMGLKQGLTNVIEAARQAKGSKRSVKWVLVGEGDAKPKLLALVAKYGLADEVILLPLQPEEEMPEMFASANLLLLSQIGAVKNTVIPSKLLTYMAAGKPVLAAVNAASQGAALLRQSDGGQVIAPDDPAALASAVLQLRDRAQDELIEMGRRNRRFAEIHFDKKRVVAFQESVLMNVVFQKPLPWSITDAELL